MSDKASRLRGARRGEIETRPVSRESLEAAHGRVWDTRQLAQDFLVLGLSPPYLLVRRKSDGSEGSLRFQQRPTLYYGFLVGERTGPAGE